MLFRPYNLEKAPFARLRRPDLDLGLCIAVGEVCFGSYGTDTTLGFSHVFRNVTVDSTVKVSSLWGSFDTLCGGVVGGKYQRATSELHHCKRGKRKPILRLL